MMKNLICLFFAAASFFAYGQDDLLEMLDQEHKAETGIVDATFKGIRLINGHTIKTRDAGTVDFIISHRFGVISSGAYNLWGLDDSNIRLGLEYAPTDRLYVGAGRNSFEKTFDAFVKYRLLRQQRGNANIPVSATLFGSSALETLKHPEMDLSLSDKMAFTSQILIARKLTSNLSLQIMPTFVHINLVNAGYERNNTVAIGTGGRFKITQRVSINAEYYHQLEKLADFTYNSLAVGVDIETGGHVFQLQFTNSRAMNEKGFITETQNDFFNGDIHFGFNISRTFHLKQE